MSNFRYIIIIIRKVILVLAHDPQRLQRSELGTRYWTAFLSNDAQFSYNSNLEAVLNKMQKENIEEKERG